MVFVVFAAKELNEAGFFGTVYLTNSPLVNGIQHVIDS